MHDGDYVMFGGLGFKEKGAAWLDAMSGDKPEPDLTKEDNDRLIFFIIQAKVLR